jgi:cobalt-zinc-cadmium efflux system protein
MSAGQGSHHHHPHSHAHGHAHAHAHARGHGRAAEALRRAAVITIVFAFVEAAGGWWTGSLALVSDAGHMVTDGAALVLGAIAAWVARRPPSQRHSYGLGRAEIFAALLNAAAMIAIAIAIAYAAVVRLDQTPEMKGGATALIALVGLALNLVVMRWLSPHGHDMNARAARLHVVGDALGSVAALLSGAVVAFSGWTRIDPLASLLICVLIAASAWRLMRDSLHALMEGVPPGLSVEEIGAEMARVEGVLSVHDLHVWTLSGSRTALSAHIVVQTLAQWERVLRDLQQRLQERFGVDHVTLQPETHERPLVRMERRRG